MDEVARSAVVIGPMGAGQVIDAGLKLARQNYRRLVTTVAYAVIPAFVIGVAVDLALGLGTARVSGFVTILGQVIASIAITILAADLVAPGREVGELSPGRLYDLTRKRIWRIILLSLVGTLLAIPLIVIFPLGIFLGIRWALALYGLIIDGDGPIACLRRSWGLTKGAWWHTFGVLMLLDIIVGLGGGLVGGLFGAIGAGVTLAGSGTFGGMFTTLGSALSGIFITPFAVTMGVVLYYELRARHEGFDLESRASQQWQTP